MDVADPPVADGPDPDAVLADGLPGVGVIDLQRRGRMRSSGAKPQGKQGQQGFI